MDKTKEAKTLGNLKVEEAYLPGSAYLLNVGALHKKRLEKETRDAKRTEPVHKRDTLIWKATGWISFLGFCICLFLYMNKGIGVI